jgi:AraC family ethanolamine operon transcriptional activator
MTLDPVPDVKPPLRHTQLLAFDPEQMTTALQDGVLEHVQLGRGLFQGRIAHTATATSRVDWGRYELAVLARGDLAQDMVSIAMALHGEGEWRVHGQVASAGDIAFYSERSELLVALPPRAQWLSIQVPRSRLEAAGLAGVPKAAGDARRMTGGMGAGLHRSLAELAPVLAPHPADPRFGSAEVALAHDDLLATLLAEIARRGGATDAGTALSPGERWRVVRRAEAWLEAQTAPSVRIDELCKAACTSLSRLERAFREAFGQSPRRYLMLRRLAAVRRELLRGTPAASITEIATRWGFFHLGRFSQEYRAHFGERPSQTLRPSRPGFGGGT